MSDIRNLEPKQLWNYFHDITQIPHPSKKEKKIVEYVVAFGKKLNLETLVDKPECDYPQTCNKRYGKPERCNLTDSSRYGSPEKQR